MYAYLKSIICLFILTVRTNLHESDQVKVEKTTHRYEDTVPVDDITALTVIVEQYQYTTTSKYWFIPQTIRHTYRASVELERVKLPNTQWVQWYPEMTTICFGRDYSLAYIARAHVRLFLNRQI